MRVVLELQKTIMNRKMKRDGRRLSSNQTKLTVFGSLIKIHEVREPEGARHNNKQSINKVLRTIRESI